MATTFETLSRSLKIFLMGLSRTSERSEKSSRVFKKPRCYKNESDGCIDTWIEVMKLRFEEERALTSNLKVGSTANDFKIDYKAAARDALNRVQHELATREIEQKVKLELENERTQEQLKTFEASEVEETKAPSSLSMKLNVILGKTFGMVPQGSKIQSIISVAGHQVTRNLSEPSEFTLMHFDIYADYLRQAEPQSESIAVQALFTTGGTRTKKLHGRYVKVYRPYQVMLNVDGISKVQRLTS